MTESRTAGETPSPSGTGGIVVLGVGNLLLTDEGVGPTMIAHLNQRWEFPPHVELVDGATAGLELINVFNRAAHIVVIDTVRGGAEPGAVFRFHPDDVPRDLRYRTSIHQISFIDAWNMARLLGPAPEITIIGVQPEDMSTPHVGLTATIEARLPAIEEIVLAELARLGVEPRPRGDQGPLRAGALGGEAAEES
ncbi:MAG: HyaD/HybD family hydrogenase maturation endopeptidase [Thermoleophilia bacterium]